MATAAFDTLTVSKELQDAGFEAKQAEAIALAVKQGPGDLATKQDIALLKSDIDHLRTEMKYHFNWINWSMAAMIAVIIGGFSIFGS